MSAARALHPRAAALCTDLRVHDFGDAEATTRKDQVQSFSSHGRQYPLPLTCVWQLRRLTTHCTVEMLDVNRQDFLTDLEVSESACTDGCECRRCGLALASRSFLVPDTV